MDKIFVKGMEFYAYHGVFPEENQLGQRFRVDLTLEADLSKAAKHDDIKDSVNYAEAYEAVKDVVEGQTYQLVETIAEVIAQTILDRFDIVQRTVIKVIKPDPPIPGHYEHVAIEIMRERV